MWQNLKRFAPKLGIAGEVTSFIPVKDNMEIHIVRLMNTSDKPLEIDFVAAKGGKKVYIQSAFALPDEEKSEQELKPFSLTIDSFPKIVVRKDIRKRWYDDNGVLNVGLVDFLLDEHVI